MSITYPRAGWAPAGVRVRGWCARVVRMWAAGVGVGRLACACAGVGRLTCADEGGEDAGRWRARARVVRTQAPGVRGW